MNWKHERNSFNCDTYTTGKSSPASLFNAHLQELSGEIGGHFNSSTFPRKFIICNYPKARISPPRKQKSSVFVRINYGWRKYSRRNSCGGHLPISGVHRQDKIPEPSKHKPVLSNVEVLRDASVGSKNTKLPYVNLGYRCDSREFKEQQAHMPSWTKCNLQAKKQDIECALSQKDIIPPTHSSGEKDPPCNQKRTEMIRVDYKQTSCSPRNCSSQTPPSSIRLSYNRKSVDSELRDSLGSSSIKTPCSGCSFSERLFLDETPDEGSSNESSCSAKMAQELCKIVNLPFDLTKIKDEEGGLMILNGERFLRQIVERLNNSGFICHGCGSKMNGRNVMKQLYT